MAKLIISLQPYRYKDADDQVHNLGNIADDVWREKLYLERGSIQNRRFHGEMLIRAERPLRKKERDELNRRIKALHKRDPELDPKIIY